MSLPRISSTAFLVVANSLNVGLQLWVAVWAFNRGSHYGWIFNAVSAVVLMGMTVRAVKKRKQADRELEAAQQRLEEMRGRQFMTFQMEARARARAKLIRVLEAAHAHFNGGDYRFQAGGYTFDVNYGHIVRSRNGGEYSSTCYTAPPTIPPEERIASVILLLRNNPSLFEKWRDNHGKAYA